MEVQLLQGIGIQGCTRGCRERTISLDPIFLGKPCKFFYLTVNCDDIVDDMDGHPLKRKVQFKYPGAQISGDGLMDAEL
eukprot:12402484-Karenia_brevis.AAC.1